jgi:hypothetical protein
LPGTPLVPPGQVQAAPTGFAFSSRQTLVAVRQAKPSP